MTRSQAQELLARLGAAYPGMTVERETIELYRLFLAPLEFEVGQLAVDSAIHACAFFPSIAELERQLAAIREQRAAERKAERQARENEQLDNLPQLDLKQIPAVQELRERWNLKPDLPEEGSGRCSDCGKTRALYRYGKFQVCGECASRRQRAGKAVGLQSELLPRGPRTPEQEAALGIDIFGEVRAEAQEPNPERSR